MNFKFIHIFSVNRYPEFFVDLILSKIQFFLLKLPGRFTIGKKAIIRGLPIISMKKHSSIRIGKQAYIISRARNTALGVNHPTILRTLKPNAQIQIGDNFKASGATICSAQKITIGDRVMLGANAAIVDTDFHAFDPAIRFSSNDALRATDANVIIGDDVFVGMNAIILKGVSIGNSSFIGAGSVVVTDVPASTIVAGNPAKVICRSAIIEKLN